MTLLTLVIFCVCFLLISGEKARYDNYRVYSIRIKDEKQFEILQDLENTQTGLFYMEAPISIYKTAEIIVAPHRFADITEYFEKYQLENEIKVDNLQKCVQLNKNQYFKFVDRDLDFLD